MPQQGDTASGRARRSGTGRELGLGLVVFAVSLTLLLIRFLVPRAISAADNGDGKRVLCGAGIIWNSDGSQDYARTEYFDAITGCESDYFLSQIWFVRAAQWIGRVIGTESSVNLVIVGVLSSVLVAASVAFVALGIPFSMRCRLAISAGLLLLLADSAFFGYFASVLGEGPAFIGITLMAGGMLLMSRPGWWRYLGMAVTVGGGIIGVNAKVQTLMILPVLLLALVFIRPQGTRGIARWAPAGLVFAAVLNASLNVQPPLDEDTGPGADTREINMFNTIFMSILDGQHDTEADLAALGLPESFSRYAANGWWHPNPARFDPEYPRYRDQISRRNVVEYLAEHPARTVQILDRAATDLLTARPEYLASFPREAGYPPLTLEYRVPVLSGATAFIAPLGLWVLLPIWVLTACAAVRAWRPRVGRRQVGVVILFVLAIAGGQYLLGGLGDGIENVKHQSIALFCTLFGVVLAAGSLLLRPRPPEPEGEPAPPDARTVPETEPAA
ncbi:hypothetical protein CFN78_10185 [Amycolatopsis antarctica]|uniref:Glycosyltransferase RgtA/B/C/D-like domain-containing protein n=1 Tax=Amycolatopsis antarctica TaxID=1854586 RepID=A0A263D6X2_9PSEU|nr:hypothetical protein [Amycolatopsis antarctica]OZM73226.1 hypothetical protein CFN78_10185 [Amycolatopsis antarctica]